MIYVYKEYVRQKNKQFKIYILTGGFKICENRVSNSLDLLCILDILWNISSWRPTSIELLSFVDDWSTELVIESKAGDWFSVSAFLSIPENVKWVIEFTQIKKANSTHTHTHTHTTHHHHLLQDKTSHRPDCSDVSTKQCSMLPAKLLGLSLGFSVVGFWFSKRSM